MHETLRTYKMKECKRTHTYTHTHADRNIYI